MLALSDVLELPPGVAIRDGRLADDVRGVTVPVNTAALLVLAAAGRPLGSIAEEPGATFALPARRAEDDVLAFAWQLNRLGLANVRRSAGAAAALLAWIVIAIRLLPAGALPPMLVRRVPIDTTGPLAAARDVVRGLGRRALAIGLLVGVAVLPAASVAGGRSLLLAGAVALGVAAGLVGHEAGHAAALAGAAPAALVLAWRRLSVVHAPVTRRRAQLVAVAGPAFAAVTGLALAATAAAVALPALAVGALPLAGHAVGLMAFTGDGRKACGT